MRYRSAIFTAALVAVAAATSALAQGSTQPRNVTYRQLTVLPFDDPAISGVITDYGPADLSASNDAVRAALRGVRVRTRGQTSLDQFTTWVTQVAAPFGGDDEPDTLVADPLPTFGDDLAPPPGDYTASFLFSALATTLPRDGDFFKVAIGLPLRDSGDPAIDQVLTVRFTVNGRTASGAPEGIPLFLFRRPTDAPPSFGLVSFTVARVPEPVTWTMMIMGMGAVGYMRRRRRTIAVPRAA